MSKVQKAGVVVLSKEKPVRIALLYQQKYNDYSFPKGHVEENETPVACAVRETKEETGLDVTIIKPLGVVNYHNVKDGNIDLFFFLGQSTDDLHVAPEKGAKVIWTPLDEVTDKLTYSNLKNFFSEVLQREKILFDKQ